jgi:hypothetical protein
LPGVLLNENGRFTGINGRHEMEQLEELNPRVNTFPAVCCRELQ